MLITAEEKPLIITPMEEPVMLTGATDSFVKQGEMVYRDSISNKEILDLKLQNIQSATTAQIRSEAAILNQTKKTKAFTETLNVGTEEEISLGLQVLAQAQADNRTALEEEVISIFQKEANNSPVWNYLKENSLPFYENLGKHAKKELIIQNKIDEIRNRGDYWDKALNLASEVTLTSFFQRATGFGVIDYTEELRNLQNELEAASPEELPDILDRQEALITATQVLGDNPEYVAGEFEKALLGRREQENELLLHLVDVLDTGLIVGDVAKVGRKLIQDPQVQAALNTNATNKLAEDVVNGTGTTTDNPLTKEILASGFAPSTAEEMFVSGAVRKTHEVNKRILNDTLQNLTSMGYDEVQALDVLDGIRNKLKADFSNGSIASVKLIQGDKAEVTMLKANGNPFVSERSAKQQMAAKGIQGAVEQLPTGGWAIKQTVDGVDANIAELSTKGIGFLTRMLRRPETWVDDDLLAFGQMAQNSMNYITGEGQKVYNNTIGKIRTKKTLNKMTPILEAMIQKGEIENAWMTDQQIADMWRSLYKQKIPAKVQSAFKGYRLLNDFQYELDNSVLYDKLQSKGFGTVPQDFFGVELNARFTENLVDSEHIFFKDVGTVLLRDDLSPETLAKYDIVEVDDIGSLMERPQYKDLAENPTKYVAVPKGQLNLEPLNPQPLKYLAGGRVRYDQNTVFLKQVNSGTYAKGGGKYRLPDRTLFTASSFPQAARQADQINEINAVLRKGRDKTEVVQEANTLLQKYVTLGTDNVAEYLAKIDARGMDINEDVKVLRDREVIGRQDLPEEISTGVTFPRNGRLSARGSETVPHVDPLADKTLTPIAALNQNFAASAQNAAFSAYRDYTLNFLERYRGLLEVEPTSPRTALLDASIRKGSGLDSGLIQRIEGEQQFAREVMGMKTEKELAAVRRNERMIEWALDKIPDRLVKNKDEIVGSLSGSFQGDPIGKLRSITFNAKLGLFSLPVMVVQMAHAPLIAAIAPVHGTKALMTTPLLRTALLAQDPDVIKAIAQKAKALDLEGYGDLELYFKEFRRHGFDNFGANNVYEDAARGDALIEGWGSKFLNKGRMFFEEGELVPRMTAYGTAVREWVANKDNINPKGLDISSKEGRKYITQRTNTLTLGMTSADIQQGLKGGWMGLAFQFQSYPMRAIDAIFLPSKGLSKAERSRLAMGYLVLAGAAGLPFVESFTNWTLNHFDKELDSPDWVYKTLYNGVVDGLIMASTGEDTNFSSRVGLGAWADEFYQSITDPRTNPIEVLLGPAGSTTSGAMDTLIQYAQVSSAGYNPDPSLLTTSMLQDIAKQVSSYNTYQRAYIAYKTGMIYDSRGNQFIGISNKGAIFQMFGFPPEAYSDISKLYNSKQDKAQITKMYTELLVKKHLEFGRTMNPDIQNEINAIMVSVDDDRLTQEVNAAVASALVRDPTHKRLFKENLTERALGEKTSLSPDVRARND